MNPAPASERIVEAAREFARESGRDVEAYEVEGVETEGSRHFVFFQGESGLPGDHFTVEVDGATEEAVMLIPGR